MDCTRSNFGAKQQQSENIDAPTLVRVAFARVPRCPGTDARVGQMPGCQVARVTFVRVPTPELEDCNQLVNWVTWLEVGNISRLLTVIYRGYGVVPKVLGCNNSFAHS